MSRDETTRNDLATLLEEMLAETGGPITPAEAKSADRAFRAPRKPRSRRRT